MTPVRYRSLGGTGYEVRLQTSAVLVGKVTKKGTGWVATRLDHRTIKDGGGQVTRVFANRNDAAQALVAVF